MKLRLSLPVLIFFASLSRSAYLWKPVSLQHICYKTKTLVLLNFPECIYCHFYYSGWVMFSDFGIFRACELVLIHHLQGSRQTGSLETLYNQDLGLGKSWSQSNGNDPDPRINYISGKFVFFRLQAVKQEFADSCSSPKF